MRILQVHNFYQQAGGEDQVYAAEKELLRSHAHEVYQYAVTNDSIQGIGAKTGAAVKAIWNPASYRNISRLIGEFGPDVVHVHNTMPVISPAVYDAARALDVPVVQTLHNYRLLCPNATFFRDGKVCEECIGSLIPYRAAMHSCYRNSIGGSAVIAAMLTTHRIAGTWKNKVARYIAATNFSKNKFVEGGLPAEKISVKPHFLSRDPGQGMGAAGYALFVGRLSPEKGLKTLLEGWAALNNSGGALPLKIAGDGPLAGYVKARVAAAANVEWLGFCEHDKVLQLMRDAAVVICPSQSYEGMPMAILEALASGTPVIASALGAMNELITDGVNGFHFKCGDSAELASCVSSTRAKFPAMRAATREIYESLYTPHTNHDQLLSIYRQAMQRSVDGQLALAACP